MSWQVRLSSPSRRDIESAVAWTLENFGRNKQDEYIELIGMAIAEIAKDPFNVRSRHRPELQKDARVLHIGRRGKKARHLFVYRVGPDGQVDVGRFLYDSMDIERHLPEGFGSKE